MDKGIRAERMRGHRQAYESNKKKILMTQDVCGICGQPVDKSLPTSDLMSATIDHIIPIAKGGHPSDIDNLQLAHRKCNRAKSDKLVNIIFVGNKKNEINNRDLPLSADWLTE